MSETTRGQLPAGWTEALIEDLFWPLEDGRTLHQGWSPQCEKVPATSDADWAVLRTTAIQAGEFLPRHNKRLPEDLPPRPEIEVKVGDILITCAGPRVRCGVACLVRSTRPRLMMSGKMYRFRVSLTRMDARFLEAFLLTSTAAAAIDKMKTGSSDSGLNLTHERFRQLPVLVAPLNEQGRIVDAIDSYLSRLDDAVASLERAQAKLKAYRASVLKAAVEGRLVPTEASLARAEKRDYEPAEVLLARILAERRRRWEESELAKLKAAGKTPKDDKWKAKYDEPSAPDTSRPPEPPEGWCWTSLGHAFTVTVGATPSRSVQEYWDGPIPWVSSGEVSFCRIRRTKESISPAGLEGSSTRLNPRGSVLLGMIGEGKTRGQTAILDIDACGNQNAAAIWVSQTEVPPEFVYHYLVGQYETTRRRGSGNNQPALNKARVEAIPLPLAPLKEQRRIVERLERDESQILAAEASIERELKRVRRLKQAILKWAFEGKLVDQDPTDEPAEQLLARIRAERAAAPARKKTNGRRKTKGPA